MITRSEAKIRELENLFDHHHENLKLFKLSRQNAILYALKHFEDACRLPSLYHRMPLEQYDVIWHKQIDALGILMDWIFNLCVDDTTPINPQETVASYYRYAMHAHNEASNYQAVCAAYISWSRKSSIAELDLKKKQLTFTVRFPEWIKLQAIDIILFKKKQIAIWENSRSRLELIKPRMQMAEEELKENMRLDGETCVRYSISPRVWSVYEYVSNIFVEEYFELPDEWTFSCFSLKELKEYWRFLLTKATIHQWVCINSGAEGLALDCVLMVTSVDNLCQEVKRASNLSYDKALAISNFITYNPMIKNVDVAWQPIIPLGNGMVVIAPNLIIKNNAERNIISLINKVEQASYSRLSSMKETVMGAELLENLSNKYSALQFAQNTQLPDRLPDMDFIIYDAENRVLFIAELKWLLAVASAQETYAREIDLKKGVFQSIQIREYVAGHTKESLRRAFGTEDLRVDEIFVCVVSKNNTGSVASEKDVPIISEFTLCSLIDKYQGNMCNVIRAIQGEDYFPVSTKEYKLSNEIIKYAGYKLIVPAVQILGAGEKFIGEDRPL